MALGVRRAKNARFFGILRGWMPPQEINKEEREGRKTTNMEERDERKERTWARRPYTTGTKKRDTMNEMTTCSREGDRKGGEDNRKKWRAVKG
jgi:hypothetical protein